MALALRSAQLSHCLLALVCPHFQIKPASLMSFTPESH